MLIVMMMTLNDEKEVDDHNKGGDYDNHLNFCKQCCWELIAYLQKDIESTKMAQNISDSNLAVLNQLHCNYISMQKKAISSSVFSFLKNISSKGS